VFTMPPIVTLTELFKFSPDSIKVVEYEPGEHDLSDRAAEIAQGLGIVDDSSERAAAAKKAEEEAAAAAAQKAEEEAAAAAAKKAEEEAAAAAAKKGKSK